MCRLPLKYCLLAFIAFGGAVSAKTSDRLLPMDMSADAGDAVLTDDGESTISGNVLITQGTLKLEADKAVITRSKGITSKVTLTGNPVRMQQQNDENELMKATAKQIVYLISAEQLSLTGGVVIDQPRGSMRGETIKYDLKTGRMTAGGDGSRIQMRLEPKTVTNPAAKPVAKPVAKPADQNQGKP